MKKKPMFGKEIVQLTMSQVEGQWRLLARWSRPGKPDRGFVFVNTKDKWSLGELIRNIPEIMDEPEWFPWKEVDVLGAHELSGN